MPLSQRSFVFRTTEQIYILQYYSLASITLLYYDHILTFREEVKHVWRRRLTLSSILFLLNRYMVFFGYFFMIYLSFFPPNDVMFCRKFIRVGGYLNLVSQIIISILLSLRTYALYNRSRGVLCLVSLLSLSTIVMSAWTLNEFFGILTSFGLGTRSVFRTCLPAVEHETLYKTTLILSTLFDSVVFLLTVTRTFQIVHQNKKSNARADLPNLLMRDGSVYFAIMMVTNLIHFVIYTENIDSTLFARSTGNNAMLSHVISVTMTSRLVLNLHRFSQKKGKATNLGLHLPPRTQRILNDSAHDRSTPVYSENEGDTRQDVAQLTTEISVYSAYSTWLGRAIDDLGVDPTLNLGEDADSSDSRPGNEAGRLDKGQEGAPGPPECECGDDIPRIKRLSKGDGVWWAQ